MSLIAREGSVCRITGIMKDESGVAIDGVTLTTLKLWLYDPDGTIINTRNGVDINGANGGSVDGDGNFALVLAADDNPILNEDAAIERHTALVEWVWAGKTAYKEIEFSVENLAYVPTS